MRKTWLIVAALVATSVPAFAAPPGLTEPAAPAPAEVDSYRLEVFALDAGAAVALAVGNRNSGVVALALGTYLLGGPILHIAHDRPGRAVASFGLRIGLPLLMGAIGAKAFTDSSNPDSDAPIAGAGLGIMTGMVSASAVDIGAFAGADQRPHMAVTPTHGGATFGLAGSF